MSVFTDTLTDDVAYGKAETAAPLSSLDSNPYSQQHFQYPSDIETLAHAMLFNINIQENSKDVGNGLEQTVNGNTQSRGQQLAQGTPQGTDLTTIQSGDDASGQTTTNVTLNRKTKRIEKTVSLYVPETLIYNEHEQYESPELLKVIGPAGAAALSGLDYLKSNQVAKAIAAFGIGAESVFNSKVGNFFGSALDPNGATQTAVKAGLGYAINPVIEVLYSHPTLREFQFDFQFAPRSRVEAKNVAGIIKTFRRHKAPEYSSAFGINGAFFIPPSEFDITFLTNTGAGFSENPYLPRISTCVLVDIVTNFAPENMWSTFYDGFPVHIHMMLRFKEVNMITRREIDAGY